MKISVTKFYTTLFVILIFLQIYVTFKANIVLQSCVITLFLMFDKTILTRGLLKIIFPLVIIFAIGLFVSIFNEYELFYIIKDITHFLKPILGMLLGYFIFRRVPFKAFIKSIVIAGFISAIIHFVMMLVFGGIHGESVNEIRNSSGRDSFIELFALLFMLFFSKFYKQDIFQSKILNKVVLVMLIFSNLFYFSRTMIIAFILSCFSIYGLTKITKTNLSIIGCLIGITLLFYIYLFSIKLDPNRGVEAFLYKIKIAPAEIFETRINRENDKDLWDHWRGYEAKRALVLMSKHPESYIIGTGFGSLIDLRFKAPLSEKKIRYISETHNGYIYIFYKTGLVGLVLLLCFLGKMYGYLYKGNSFVHIFISAIGVVYFFTTLTITGIYNTQDVIIFIVGGLFVFLHNKGYQQQKTLV